MAGAWPPGRYYVNSQAFERVDRPKTKFAPISAPGRGTYTGTILVYNKGSAWKGSAWPKLVTDKGTFDLILQPLIQFDDSLGIIDRIFAKHREPLELTVCLPWFSDN